jgi:RNA polymerase sigma-70 factor (ECF subfamily)
MEPAQADAPVQGAGGGAARGAEADAPAATRAEDAGAPAPAHPTRDPEEAAWVARAAAGDEAAFRMLVERHQHLAYGLAQRILRSPEDAREVAQESFVRAWLALPRFRGEARFATWLHRIVARRAVDRAEVLKRRRARETPADEAAEIAAPPGPGAEASARARRMEALVRERLSEAQQTVVALFYWEGHSVETVSEMLGMPTGTVKTHLHRARAALREAIEEGEA